MKKTIIVFALLLSGQFAIGQASEEALTVNKEFRIAVQGGYGYRLAKVAEGTPSYLKNYINNLKYGYSFGIDAAYFLQPDWGLGLKFSRFGSTGSMSNMTITYDDGRFASGTMSDDIRITFVGPSFVSKYALRNPAHNFFGGLSLGYLRYKDQGRLVNETLNSSGTTFGAAIDFGYDYSISKHVTIGAQASVTGGSLSKITQESRGIETTVELDEEHRENLSRLDISAGVRFKI